LTNFIPIFPLNLVVFPGESLNLHIFEPRYRQLVSECLQSGKPFGIPAVVNDQLMEMGALVEIVELSQLYEDGRMDIKTRGIAVFKILELIKEIPEKLYGGAIVNYPDNNMKGSRPLMKIVLEGMYAIHHKLNVEKKFSKVDEELNSYDVAHHIGLSIEEEYEFMQLTQEIQRQEYLKRHITRVIPMMEEMDALRRKIRQNGHFKNLEGFKFT
jgi:Lon protease-like protein